MRAKASVLGPPVRIEAVPRSAEIEIDGIAVGAGSWEGRLAVDSHSIEAYKESYHRQSREIVSRKNTPPSLMALKLPIDRDHPRWPSPP